MLLTPHIGGSTNEAQEAVGYQIAHQVKEYLKDGVIQNAVNVPSLSHDEYVELQPYIVLAERLGAFLAQVSDGSLVEVSLRYSGHVAEGKTELIRNAAIKGILNHQGSEEKANLVNAAAMAASRGLPVHEAKKSKTSGSTESVISLLLKTAQEEHIVKGSVIHKEVPRLMHVDGIDVEAPLETNLIYMRNDDVPGVIGKSRNDSRRAEDQHRELLAGTPRGQFPIPASLRKRLPWFTWMGAFLTRSWRNSRRCPQCARRRQSGWFSCRGGACGSPPAAPWSASGSARSRFRPAAGLRQSE